MRATARVAPTAHKFYVGATLAVARLCVWDGNNVPLMDPIDNIAAE